LSSCDPLWAVAMAPQAETGASPRKHESTREAGTITRAVPLKALAPYVQRSPQCAKLSAAQADEHSI
ncbi:MAG: hypothetical protein WA231_05115, partial [Methylocella sp.]